MPDTNPPVSTGAPLNPGDNPQDDEAIAEQGRMEMSAPIEQDVASDPINGVPFTGEPTPPASAAAALPITPVTPAPTVPQPRAPLAANVAPFAPAAQPRPEVEYVPIAPEDLMPPPPPAPTVPIPEPVQTPPPPAPAPMDAYVQPPPVPDTPPPAPPIEVSQEITTAPEALGSMVPPSAVAMTGSLDQGAHAAGPAMKYSHNTHAVWKSQRSSKMLRLFAWGGLLLFFGAIFVYWLIIGSPTRAEDIPLIKSLIK